MDFISNTTEFRLDYDTVVTIGKFDGFHLGHVSLVNEAIRQTEGRLKTAVLTFAVSPQAFMSGRVRQVLLCEDEKLERAEQVGVDTLIEFPFNDEIRHMDAHDFLEKIIVGKLNAKHVIAGPDCHFGYKGLGDSRLLIKEAERFGYGVTIVDKIRFKDEVISSTRIRDCISDGKIADANAMLGYRYGVDGEVIHGRQLGRTLGLPTINLKAPEDKLMPKFGVYAVEILLGDRRLYGMANVGCKPSIEGDNPIGIETNIFDFNEDVYGKNVRVNFLEFIRPEMRFESLDALVAQIMRDKQKILDNKEKYLNR